MSSSKPHVHTEIADTDTYALILGREIPFLAGILSSKLEDSGCIVHADPQRGIHYDYIIAFGPRKEQELIKLISPSGKALLLITHEHETPDTHIPVLSLSDTSQISADSLAASILEKLIMSKPLIKKNPQSQHAKPPVTVVTEKKAPPQAKPLVTRTMFRKMLLIVLPIIIIMSPFVILAGTLAVSATNLKKAAHPSNTREQRSEHIRIVRISNSIMKPVYKGVRPVVSVSQDAVTVTDNIVSIVEEATDAFTHLELLEDSLSQKDFHLTTENPSLVTDVIPTITNSLTQVGANLQTIESSITRLKPYASWWGISRIVSYEPYISQARKAINAVDSLARFAPSLLGTESEKKYLVLLQNNFELRPTGGFIGSYALVTVKNGGVTNIHIEDVYEADGQLKGRVDPPKPIAIHLAQPNWFLRDSNWEPDFSDAASRAEWFYEKEKEQTIDGVIGIDLYVIQHILTATGPLYVPDYQSTVSADDFFVKIQSDTGSDFFPGSTKKRDLLNALATTLVLHLTEHGDSLPASLGLSLFTSLEEKHLMLALHDNEAQRAIDSLGWGGRILEPTQETTNLSPYRSDYLMVVDANLGVNKANYYIERELFTTTSVTDTGIARETTMYYKNNSPYRDSTFSGTYKNYVRVLIPLDSSLSSVVVDDTVRPLDTDVTIDETARKKSVGFLVTVPPQKQSKVVLTYTLPIPSKTRFLYQLMVQKQPGTDSDPFIFKTPSVSSWHVIESSVPSIPYLTSLRTDTLITVDFQAGTE